MKIKIMSDLHLECLPYYDRKFIINDDDDADIVVLAGDIISDITDDNYEWPIVSSKPVIYVPGNHEYYYADIVNQDQYLQEILPNNVYLLNNDYIIIDGVRFLGTTLWTDFLLYGESLQHLHKMNAQTHINDYRLISYMGRRFTADDCILLHQIALSWLQEHLHKSFDGPTVIVTHHAPSMLSVDVNFLASNLNAAYASSLEWLFDQYDFDLWVHGHTHSFCSYKLYDIPVLCNPRGYFPYNTNKLFNRDLIYTL